MWFAQTPLPAELPANVTIPAGIQTEMITHPSFTMTQSVLLVIYFLIALALVICVTVQTGKSEGLMQQSMAGPSNSGPKGGGKVSADDRLASLTTNLAYVFLFLSAAVAYFIKIV
jgi:protein translocase SecG subunit